MLLASIKAKLTSSDVSHRCAASHFPDFNGLDTVP